MAFDTEVKLVIYRQIAVNADMPTIDFVAHALDTPVSEIRSAYLRLLEKRVLVLEPDGECIAHFAVPAARWWEDIAYT